MKCPNCSHEFDLKELHKKHKPSAIKILEHLNKMAGRSYRPLKANLGFIIARLVDGATEESCLQVIDKKCSDWRTNDDMKIYLRPATLFNPTKFAQYDGEIVATTPQEVKKVYNKCHIMGCTKIGVVQENYRSGKIAPRYCRQHFDEKKRLEEIELERKYNERRKNVRV